MRRACSTHWEEIYARKVLAGTSEEKCHYEDRDVGSRILVKWTLEE
jgi:hypothetical protein